MMFTQCKTCGRIKFRCNDKIFWKELTPVEEGALAIIYLSDYLIAMVGGLKIYDEECPDCELRKLN